LMRRPRGRLTRPFQPLSGWRQGPRVLLVFVLGEADPKPIGSPMCCLRSRPARPSQSAHAALSSARIT